MWVNNHFELQASMGLKYGGSRQCHKPKHKSMNPWNGNIYLLKENNF